MSCFSGLDLSINETAICVVEGDGAVLMREQVATNPATIAELLALWCRRCAASATQRARCCPDCTPSCSGWAGRWCVSKHATCGQR
jgi:hypothetical protein